MTETKTNRGEIREGQSSDRNKSPLPSLRVGEILVPVDFSEPSKVALKHAISIANHFDSLVIVLQVVKPLIGQETVYPSGTYVEQITFNAERVLNEICQRAHMTPPRNARMLVKYGIPCEQIVAIATDRKTDLIVIGTRGRGALAHAFLGGTTENVIRHAPCPVLVVRPNESSGFAQ